MSKLGNSTVLTGDLNGRWDSSRASHKLKEWADNNGWQNHLHVAAKQAAFPVHTYWKGAPISWIDHILTYGESGRCTLQGIQTACGTFFTGLSDHQPIMATFQLSGGQRNSKYRRCKPAKWENKPIVIDLKNKEEVALIHTHLTKWLTDFPPNHPRTQAEAGEYLLAMNRAAVDALVEVKNKGCAVCCANWKKYKDGWSPTMIALKAQLQATQQMLGHLTGRNHYSKWMTPEQASIDIVRITEKWQSSVIKLTWSDNNNPHDIMMLVDAAPRTGEPFPTIPHKPSYSQRLKGSNGNFMEDSAQNYASSSTVR